MIDNLEITENTIKKIGRFADNHGFRIYVVGGYVRDHFLDRTRTDFDFTVEGDAVEFAELLGKELKSKPVIYQRFRTALVPYKQYKLEFVGTRKEEYHPESRKPIVSEGSLEDDLRRRDFTINAMAVSINQDSFGKVTDLFGGQKDLEIKLLRTPLEPTKTFSDDPLRMMRAARFASQLGFTMENETTSAISNMYERIKIISQERISDEFLKILASPKPSVGLKILYETKLLKLIFPELYILKGVETVQDEDKIYGHKDVFLHSLHVLDNIASVSDNLWLRFAALVHDMAKADSKQFVKGTGWTFHGHEEIGARKMARIFRRMKLPLIYLDYVETLVRLHQRPMSLVDDGVSDSAVRRLAFQAGDALEDLFVLCKADITTKNPNLSARYLENYEIVAMKVMDVQEKDKLREFQSPVRGEEIMELCNLPPSRAVGYIKAAIENAILDGLIANDYEEAKKYFLNNKLNWLEEIKSEKNNAR